MQSHNRFLKFYPNLELYSVLLLSKTIFFLVFSEPKPLAKISLLSNIVHFSINNSKVIHSKVKILSQTIPKMKSQDLMHTVNAYM